MTLLILGCHGQVGFACSQRFMSLGHVIALDRHRCDLSHVDQIRRAVHTYLPDIVINAAAYTAVDQAESNADHAFAVNATAVGVLAEEVKKQGSLLIHYSTDYVFDGYQAEAYCETDTASPQSVYGKSKLAGEQAILATGVRAWILRLSWIASAQGHNFAKTILTLAGQRDHLRVVADQWGAPTSAALVADVTATMIAQAWPCHEVSPQIYHLASAGQTTWYGYATEVLRYAIAHGVVLKVAPENVEAITTAQYQLAPARPANSCLNTQKLRHTFDMVLPDWQQGIHAILDQIFFDLSASL